MIICKYLIAKMNITPLTIYYAHLGNQIPSTYSTAQPNDFAQHKLFEQETSIDVARGYRQTNFIQSSTCDGFAAMQRV